jgi:hypothetical protein
MRQRDSCSGQYLPGHSLAGPGRPSKQVEYAYIRAISRACPPKRLRKIVDRLCQAAEAGDHLAAALLLKYCVPDAAKAWAQVAVPEEPMRVGGFPSREAAETYMVERCLRLAQERQAADMVRQQRQPKIKRIPASFTVKPESKQ